MPASAARSAYPACAISLVPPRTCTGGQKATLEDAARFYTGGRGHEVPEGESLMIHWHIWEPQLTDREIQLLATFMGALTDEAFMPEIPTAVPSGLPVTHARQFASGNDVGFGAQ
ncbi:MAG: hypothetical protein CM15mP103_02120 [Gammaproteobacteria bacterium]|nr:MAG: hypothetical protein CM15mP103_02120 [Gammaproteobacteria bacterium]